MPNVATLNRNITNRTKSFHQSNNSYHRENNGKPFEVQRGSSCVVTGGGTGIGLMITQALVTNGAKVYVTSQQEKELKKVVDQYSTGPGKIIAWDLKQLTTGHC